MCFLITGDDNIGEFCDFPVGAHDLDAIGIVFALGWVNVGNGGDFETVAKEIVQNGVAY